MSTATDSTVLERTKLKTPKMWVVVLHNDDFTPMDFVVELLEQVFDKVEEEAEAIMLRVHNEGRSRVHRYTREIAETKVNQAMELATAAGHPLLCTAEEE